MNIRNCRKCGRIFNYVAGAFLCPQCREEMEVKFQEVKGYIRDNPGVGITQVSEACDVDPSQIRQWLREDRLEVTENSAIFLNCESCGTPIRSGRYCDKCKYDMTMGLKSAMKPSIEEPKQEKNTKDNPRMRYL